MGRLEAFERMLADIQGQAEYEAAQMERLRSEGKEKTATFRQYLGNRMLYQTMLAKYREYGLIEWLVFSENRQASACPGTGFEPTHGAYLRYAPATSGL